MKRLSFAMGWLQTWGLALSSVVVLAVCVWRSNDELNLRPWHLLLAVGVLCLASLLARYTMPCEIIDQDDRLLARRGKLEDTVLIGDIEKVTANYWIRPHRVTLHLRTPGKLGRRIVFVPRPNSFFGTYGESDVVVDLRQRIAMQRALG